MERVRIGRSSQAKVGFLQLIVSIASSAIVFLVFVSPAFAYNCYLAGGTQTQTWHPVYWDYSRMYTVTVTVPSTSETCGFFVLTDSVNLAHIEVKGEGNAPATLASAHTQMKYSVTSLYWEIHVMVEIGTWAPSDVTFSFPLIIKKTDYSISLRSLDSSVEPGESLPFIATVIDQNTGQPTTNPVQVHVSLKVDPISGGHDHGKSDRPRGGIATVKTCGSDGECWSNPTDNGAVVSNFNAPEASGKYTISATCDGCSNNPQTAEVKVMVKEAQAGDLKPIPASSLYALQDSGGTIIGAIPHKHEDNHHLTAAAVAKLVKLSRAYKNSINPGKILYLNDASLEWGGLFDVGGNPWRPPHKGHRHGVEIDIRAAAAANGNPVKEGAIPFALFWEFWNEAQREGLKADLHCMENRQLVIGSSCYWLPEARHYHVKLN